MAVVNFALFCFIPINLVAFYKKNNQEKQDIFTAIELFSNDSGKSGRNGKCGKYIFRKKWAQRLHVKVINSKFASFWVDHFEIRPYL